MSTTNKEEETKVKFATVDPLFTYGVKPGVKGGLYFTKIDTLIYRLDVVFHYILKKKLKNWFH